MKKHITYAHIEKQKMYDDIIAAWYSKEEAEEHRYWLYEIGIERTIEWWEFVILWLKSD